MLLIIFRYARWSLGFVNPPLEIAGTGQKCTVKALNERGNILLPAVIDTMNKLLADNILEDVQIIEGQVDVIVMPPGEVGSFSEEERSKQVCLLLIFSSFLILLRFKVYVTHNLSHCAPK